MTLFANGYLIEGARQVGKVCLLRCSRTDHFDNRLAYLIGICQSGYSQATAEEVRKLAADEKAIPVLVGEVAQSAPSAVFSMDAFLARFGGPVESLLPLEPTFAEQLRTLGNNELPNELPGPADKRFEEHVRAGLQFMFGTRVLGYGKGRSGQSVPDGLALRTGSYVLYDAKASAAGYKLQKEEMRKFADYVDDFHARYKKLLGPAFAFLVVSATFQDDPQRLEDRSNELFAMTKTTKLCCLDAEGMVAGIEVVRADPRLREGIDWNGLLARAILTRRAFEDAAKAAKKDQIH